MRRAGPRITAPLAALLLLSAAARCAPAAPASTPGPDPRAGALAAARAQANAVAVAPAPGYTRERIPVYVWGQIAGLSGIDPTTLADFDRRNAAPAPLPRLASTRVAIRQDAAGTPGTLTLRLSPPGFSAAGDQALVVAETVSAGGTQGEAFLLRRAADGWRVAAWAVLFIS